MANNIYMVGDQPYEVSDEKKDKFLKDFPNAVLKSDEPGKVSGANPPQNNQNKNIQQEEIT